MSAASSAELVSTQSASSGEPESLAARPLSEHGIRRRSYRPSIDRAGVLLSILCGVHCLLIPLVLVLAPWIAHSSSWERAESVAVWSAVTLVAVVVIGDRSQRLDPRLLTGAATLVVAQVAGLHLLIPVGSAFLIFGHVRRLRTRKCGGHSRLAPAKLSG